MDRATEVVVGAFVGAVLWTAWANWRNIRIWMTARRAARRAFPLRCERAKRIEYARLYAENLRMIDRMASRNGFGPEA